MKVPGELAACTNSCDPVEIRRQNFQTPGSFAFITTLSRQRVNKTRTEKNYYNKQKIEYISLAVIKGFQSTVLT